MRLFPDPAFNPLFDAIALTAFGSLTWLWSCARDIALPVIWFRWPFRVLAVEFWLTAGHHLAGVGR